jgi:hypothetical protein
MRSVIPKDVTHIPGSVSTFSPENNEIILADGSKIS